MPEPRTITRLLQEWSGGNRAALDRLAPHVQRELYSLARACLNRDRRNQTQTLEPGALISELYLRLIGQARPVKWEDRSHFFGIAAHLLRNVLVDYARARRAAKRGGEAVPVTLRDAMTLSTGSAPDILAVDQALDRLAQLDNRKARVIELRYFGGMNREEIAVAAGLTLATVKNDLRLAEAWLRRELAGQTPLQNRS